MIRRTESQVELSPGSHRYSRAWLPPESSRAMILVHGFAEHSGRYDEMAMHFAQRGVAVHAYDQVGHGRTRGPRGHVDRYDRLLEELARFVELVGLEHPGLPITLVGHSMGGLVVAGTAAFLQPPVDRIVLSGALLEVPSNTPPWMRWLARLMSPLGPRISMASGLDADGISRDPEVVRRYLADPYVEDKLSACFAAGMMNMAESVQAAPARIERPILILHGEDDPICNAEGSRRFYAGLSPSIEPESALEVYPGLRHEIFNEPERERVWRDMLDWQGQRTAESGS